MKKKELVKVLLEFFHTKQDEVLSLKYIFEQLHAVVVQLVFVLVHFCDVVVHRQFGQDVHAQHLQRMFGEVEANRYSWPNATRHTP